MVLWLVSGLNFRFVRGICATLATGDAGSGSEDRKSLIGA